MCVCVYIYIYKIEVGLLQCSKRTIGSFLQSKPHSPHPALLGEGGGTAFYPPREGMRSECLALAVLRVFLCTVALVADFCATRNHAPFASL